MGKDPKVQKEKGQKLQRQRGPEIQKGKGPKAQKERGCREIQKGKGPKVQRESVQRMGGPVVLKGRCHMIRLIYTGTYIDTLQRHAMFCGLQNGPGCACALFRWNKGAFPNENLRT